jgi:hypothetical protein
MLTLDAYMERGHSGSKAPQTRKAGTAPKSEAIYTHARTHARTHTHSWEAIPLQKSSHRTWRHQRLKDVLRCACDGRTPTCLMRLQHDTAADGPDGRLRERMQQIGPANAGPGGSAATTRVSTPLCCLRA